MQAPEKFDLLLNLRFEGRQPKCTTSNELVFLSSHS